MLQISELEIKSRLKLDNPWWVTGIGIDPKRNDFPRRFYFNAFHSLVIDRSINRAVILMGPRRVGKTVMAYHSIHELLTSGVAGHRILYLSLETPLYTGLSLEKILGIFQSMFDHTKDDEIYVFYDEIQYLRDWEIHLKSLVDTYGNYKFVATGSAAAALRLKSTESGAGRFTDFVLPPLTFAEYLFFIGRESSLITMVDDNDKSKRTWRTDDIEQLNLEFINYLNYGGYPEAVFSPTIQGDSERYIKSDIIDKVLLRDLPSLYGISDIQELNRLFTTLAYNTGNEVTLEGLSKSAGVAKNTLKRYMEYLEAAFLIRRVHRIDQNARHFRRATSFKVYLTNPSMRAALFGRIDSDSECMGNLTETAIYSQWLHSNVIDNLYYSRWDEGEIDIVCLSSEQRPMWIVEVKWSDRPIAEYDLLKNIIHFLKKHTGINDALVTTKTANGLREISGYRFEFRPSSLYAYTLGKNILAYKFLKH